MLCDLILGTQRFTKPRILAAEAFCVNTLAYDH